VIEVRPNSVAVMPSSMMSPWRGADEVDFGNVLGHHTLVAQLDDGVDRRLFVDPAQQATAEQRAVRIEVFGFYPLAGVEIHVHS